MASEIFEELSITSTIKGARNIRTFFAMLIFLSAGFGFFFTGLASYLNRSFLFFSSTAEIRFIPHGIIMLFYGTLAIILGLYNLFLFFFNIGSGYNEFSKKESLIRIVRMGFPGKNRKVFFSYDFKSTRKIRLMIKKGINPRYNVYLLLKDAREIPLFPADILLGLAKAEEKAILLSAYLNVPLEIVTVE